MALADCPNAMPVQLLEGCIVYEDAGHVFPASDYEHMGLYSNWMAAQKAEQAKALAMEEYIETTVSTTAVLGSSFFCADKGP